ncbi:MAG: bifunctional (p)ppGpp synthetase/guanosine-3',5'-bis(diphosphate) 3'-pyrophosphohydrolase [Oscillospiraceae bacterium]|nr:bifunctional (p)ppGpp synthetase/guanosine-3',5'-bis(diphosphate) 3'-pyrophosphohydrolase [Oscillospiraceae bacterium]
MTLEQRARELAAKYAPEGGENARIAEAYAFAAEAHKDQFRQSGEPYVTHALAVAEIVADMALDEDSVVAALLHDTVEDTSVTIRDIVDRFGETVAEIVDGLTKLERIPYSSKEEQEVENLRKMLMAMSKDIRVILVKLADRLHNIRTLDAKPDAKRRLIALETMDVYSPIAHRLGITTIKTELEDRSLRYLDPIGYDEIVSALENTAEFRSEFIARVKENMAEKLSGLNIKNLSIEGRVKSLYSIYRKMFMQNKTIDEIYDLYAIRVIVDTKEECYNVLGVIHDLYKPMPRRFKDYISTPKPNLYQSLHTTLIGREGTPFEVQIRTWEMHHVAEYGVAAHWKYKEGGVDVGEDYEKKLGWIRSMLETQQDSDAEDFISNFKTDMFTDEVYVFTPKGDVINLPAGATTIDFAYAIHSGVGNRMVGAKVNNRIVPIDTVLNNGDIVEILTSKVSRGPGRDWINIVRTSEARTKIKQWYKKERREENIVQGREALDAELKKNGILLADAEKTEGMLAACRRLSFNTVEDMLAGIGYGGLAVQRAANRIREELGRPVKPEQPESSDQVATVPVVRRSESGVIVEGAADCLVKFARCCTPVPGDEIVGFVTRGYGVSVHRAGCANVSGMAENRDRFVGVCWADVTEGSFAASIEITARDRVTLIADITAVLANQHIPIHGIQTKKNGGGEIVLQLDISVNDRRHLEAVCGRIHGVRGVVDVVRSGMEREAAPAAAGKGAEA